MAMPKQEDLKLGQHLLADERQPLEVEAENISGTFYRVDTLNTVTVRVGVSTTFSADALAVPAGAAGITIVNATRRTTESYKRYIATPQYDVYVDNDLDPDYLFPYGDAFIGGGATLVLPIITCTPTIDGVDMDAGRQRFVFNFYNFDSAQQTYYLHVRFINAPTNPSNAT